MVDEIKAKVTVPGLIKGKVKTLVMTVTAFQSDPPEGKSKITNIYWDPVTEELVFDHED